MASRNFNRKQALEKEVKELYLNVAIGASGAPTLTTGQNVGIQSITRDTAGVYIITLQDAYTRLMSMQVMNVAASSQDLVFAIEAQAVATTKTIQFRCLTANVETDPASGSVLLIQLNLKNSSV
jgi:hypothetical protein